MAFLLLFVPEGYYWSLLHKAIYFTWYLFTNLSISRAITVNKIKDGILKTSQSSE
jgi:hypothetical protein